ncbi:MAG: hypothetical protein COB45_01745 [Gammaproteobacteria bacterium]|nr:MAG: hypothetical protein COB45_01745 [Gammaproteobacteria bacterium]
MLLLKNKSIKYVEVLAILISLFIFLISYYSKYYAGFEKTFIQTVIYSKFIIIFFLLYYVVDEYFHKFIKFIYVFTFLGFLTNLVLGAQFYELFNARLLERNGIFRFIGFQYSANVFAIAASVLVFYSLYNFSRIYSLIISIVAIVMIILSGSHTAILLLLMLYGTYYVDLRGVSGKKILLGLALIPLFIMLIILGPIGDKMYEISDRFSVGNDSGYARTVVLFNAILIAKDNFPLGSGAATYATPLSRDSSIYQEYGMDQVAVIKSFLQGTKKSSGVYDTSFGMLIGELGFLGTCIFFYLHFKIFHSIYKCERKGRFVIFCLSIVLIFIASTKPLFIQWDFAIYMSLMLIIPLRFKKRHLMNRLYRVSIPTTYSSFPYTLTRSKV